MQPRRVSWRLCECINIVRHVGRMLTNLHGTAIGRRLGVSIKG